MGVRLRVETGTSIYVSVFPLDLVHSHVVWIGRERGWCQAIVWVRVESGTVAYVSPPLLNHTLGRVVG